MRRRQGTGVRGSRDLSVILVWLDGGPPQHETYDPKPDAPVEFRGPLKPLSTNVPGIQVSELLPYHARLMDKMAIIRSMHHNNGDHFAAAHWMLTGYLGSNAVNSGAPASVGGFDHRKVEGGEEPGDARVRRVAEHALGRPRPRLPWRGVPGGGSQPVLGGWRSELRRLPGSEPGLARRGRFDPARRSSRACSRRSMPPGETWMRRA